MKRPFSNITIIFRITEHCNFACTFCASNKSDILHSTDKVPEPIKEFFKITDLDTLVITGGEPLMMSPSYYKELLSVVPEKVKFLMTSNLKDFYLHPDKWEELFKNPRISIGTSFQYGDERRWDKDTPYTEEMFLKVMTLFKDRIGYTPAFIALINEDNEHLALDHVYLARKLGTTLRINNTRRIGHLAPKTYPRYKLFKIYLEVIENGLEEFEPSCTWRGEGQCSTNINRDCHYTIHTVYIDNNNKVHYYPYCEDTYYLDRDNKIPSLAKGRSFDNFCRDKITPRDMPFDSLINDQCPCCELFKLCNACDVHRELSKEDPNHCEEMLKLKDRIIKAGWKLY